MKLLFSAACCALLATPATASECRSFVGELEGANDIRYAEFIDDETAILTWGDGEEETYWITSSGTGVPYSGLVNAERPDKGFPFRFHKGDLILNMEVFTPDCPD